MTIREDRIFPGTAGAPPAASFEYRRRGAGGPRGRNEVLLRSLQERMLRSYIMKRIAECELWNRSGEILQQVEAGQEFTITVDGRPVAVLGPHQRRQWVPRAEVLRILRSQEKGGTFSEDLGELGGHLEHFEEKL